MLRFNKETDLNKVQMELNELEVYYVECFKDETDIYILSQIWSRIKELRNYVEQYKTSN